MAEIEPIISSEEPLMTIERKYQAFVHNMDSILAKTLEYCIQNLVCGVKMLENAQREEESVRGVKFLDAVGGRAGDF